MKLLGLYVNIAGEDIVEDDVLYEGTLIVLFVVKALDVTHRYCEKLGHLLCHLVLALNEYDVLVFAACSHITIGISANCNELV